MFGKVYHIAVAVCAVSLLVVLVFGALFIVIQGLVSHFLAVDLWTPIADAPAPLFADLGERARALWDLVARETQALWQSLSSWVEGAAVTPDAGSETPD